MFIQLLFWLFIVFIAIQCIYGVFFLSAGSKTAQLKHEITAELPVSVIICAKNEARNLQQYLPSILTQRYMNDAGNPLFEVVVVDDASTDSTAGVLQELQSTYSHLRVIYISAAEKKGHPGKKYALAKGVTEAKYKNLVFTDADCEPASENWLSLITEPLREGKAIVAGYGKYKEENGMLNAFIRWETVHSFIQYSSYALAGKPYMAVGRNLACTKDTWLSAQAVPVWKVLPSGDDDLLIQTQANKNNLAVIAEPPSFTITEAKKRWKDWVHQKQRHMSTGKYYRPDIKALLSIYASSHAAMWLLFLILLFNFNPVFVGDIMAVRCFLYAIVFAKTTTKLEEKKLVMYYLLFDFCWMLYNFAFSPYIIWKNKKQWT